MLINAIVNAGILGVVDRVTVAVDAARSLFPRFGRM
jgi:hypothetical protein